jgi:flap endonuclease-1
MGIKYLNKFLKENASKSINISSISVLSGKKIAVDISIYMYKYASENNLIENMYLLLSIFRHYNIIPIFIFDGKPPNEKKELLQKRREDKKAAQEEYNILKNTLSNNTNMDDNDRQEIINNMDMLKKKIVYISKNDIENVKNLIRAYGATYYDAPGEADSLCAMLTIKGKVWGCLSEDMDMFVYGCPRVIRYLSLLNHTVVIYDMKGILENLGINQKELREICILSGTDYNIINNSKIQQNLYTTLKYFKKYFKEKKKEKDEINQINFYDWLLQNSDYINDYELLKNIYDIFDLSKEQFNIKVFENIKIVNGPIIKSEINNILKEDGFIFP